ncbi:MAG: MFS transporter, partial [Frankia sp.]
MDPRGQLRPLFARPRFAILYATRLTSQASDGIFQACLAGYVLFSPQRATSPGTIAISLAIVLLPFSVIGPFTGIILDRVPRQRALVASSVIRAGLLVVLAALIAAGHTGVDFYAAALTIFSVSRFVNAALSACLPVVVPPSDDKALVTANALTTTSGTIATLLGAGIGSGLRGLIGGDDRQLAIVAAVAAASYLAAALTASRAGRADFGPLEPKPWAAALGQVSDVADDL